MFEKISGFFKQFTSRRKRQSGETTIMQSKEDGADEFGLDAEFGDTEDAGGYDPGELDLDTFGDTGGIGDGGDLGGVGEFPDSEGFADTVGVGDFGAQGGEVSAALDAGIDGEARVEDAFSDFDATGSDADISTGGTDFDERTVSDEISGLTEDAFDEGGTDFDAGPAAPSKAGSPIKAILTVVIAAVIAIGVGAAFQIFAWEHVSKMVGLASADEAPIDPQALLANKSRKKGQLTKQLGEYTEIGDPAHVQSLKKQIAESRDAQGPMNKVEAGFGVVKKKETVYDSLLKRVAQLETANKNTATQVENVKTEIESAKTRVILLARRTEEEYKRFQFELTRAELGQRLLIELKLRYIASFKADVAKLEQRLSKLSTEALSPIALPEEPLTADTPED